MQFNFKKSVTENLHAAHLAFGNGKADNAAEMILSNATVLDYIENQSRAFSFSTTPEAALLARAIDQAANITVRIYEKEKKPLPITELLRQRGVIKSTTVQNSAVLVKSIVENAGPVRWYSDMSDDMPTQGTRGEDSQILRVMPFANSVRVGILELRRGAAEGRNIIQEGITSNLRAHAEFVESVFAAGDINKGIFGLLSAGLFKNMHVVPASNVNAGRTIWEKKTATEMLADLNLMKVTAAQDSDAMIYPADIILSLNSLNRAIETQMPSSNGTNVLGGFALSQSQVAELTGMPVSRVTAHTALNDIGAPEAGQTAKTQGALVGTFNDRSIQALLATSEILPTEYHSSHYHIPMLGACSGVSVIDQSKFGMWSGL